MKKLICGCAVTEEADALVRVGALAVGHKLEECEQCKVPPVTATHWSSNIDAWIRFTESGNCERFSDSKWLSLSKVPTGLIPKFGPVVKD